MNTSNAMIEWRKVSKIYEISNFQHYLFSFKAYLLIKMTYISTFYLLNYWIESTVFIVIRCYIFNHLQNFIKWTLILLCFQLRGALILTAAILTVHNVHVNHFHDVIKLYAPPRIVLEICFCTGLVVVVRWFVTIHRMLSTANIKRWTLKGRATKSRVLCNLEAWKKKADVVARHADAMSLNDSIHLRFDKL